MANRVELGHREYHRKLTMMIESLGVNAAVVVWSSMMIKKMKFENCCVFA
jgi:hypothetical protein